MQRDHMLLLYDYNYWANARILEALENLSNEQLNAPTTNGYGSLRETLVHMLSAEWMWRRRWQGTSPTTRLNSDDFPTLASICTRWHEEERQMRAFLVTLHDEDLARVVLYKNTAGEEYGLPLWQMMFHLLNHSTQHRREIAMVLTELGHSPGELDFLLFLPD